MKLIFEKWWNCNTKVFQVTNYKKAWKENGNKPKFRIYTNGGKRKDGDNCFDLIIILGYTIFNYTNFALQNYKKRGKLKWQKHYFMQ